MTADDQEVVAQLIEDYKRADDATKRTLDKINDDAMKWLTAEMNRLNRELTQNHRAFEMRSAFKRSIAAYRPTSP